MLFGFKYQIKNPIRINNDIKVKWIFLPENYDTLIMLKYWFEKNYSYYRLVSILEAEHLPIGNI